VYATVRPHSHLLFTWALDFNELSGSRTRDAYGMIDGLSQGLYIRAGRFRNPFGLRLDDHTAGTRYGFLNPPSDAGGALPYDPREPQTGIELGAAPGPWFGSLAVQNANGAFFEDVHTVALKWGFNHRPVQVAISGYDSYHSLVHDRATRWGAYGLWGWRNLTLVAEAVGGEDRSPAGDITRVAGLYGEAGYAFTRALALNARWDFADIDRDASDEAKRWMAEGVWTPVPFADLRLSYRRIQPHVANDEDQILAMMHFYY